MTKMGPPIAFSCRTGLTRGTTNTTLAKREGKRLHLKPSMQGNTNHQPSFSPRPSFPSVEGRGTGSPAPSKEPSRRKVESLSHKRGNGTKNKATWSSSHGPSKRKVQEFQTMHHRPKEGKPGNVQLFFMTPFSTATATITATVLDTVRLPRLLAFCYPVYTRMSVMRCLHPC